MRRTADVFAISLLNLSNDYFWGGSSSWFLHSPGGLEALGGGGFRRELFPHVEGGLMGAAGSSLTMAGAP